MAHRTHVEPGLVRARYTATAATQTHDTYTSAFWWNRIGPTIGVDARPKTSRVANE